MPPSLAETTVRVMIGSTYIDTRYVDIVPMEEVARLNNEGATWPGYQQVDLPQELVERYLDLRKQLFDALDGISALDSSIAAEL